MLLRRNWYVMALGLAVYTGTEVLCLLFGYGILATTPQVIGFTSGLTVSAYLFGTLLEAQLFPHLNRDKRFDERKDAGELYKPFLRGLLYFVPVVLAFEGRLASWKLVLSLVCYIALMLRVVWCLAICPSEGEQPEDLPPSNLEH